ncbi:hypothetical protein RV15_GL003005 [Enterococcus silesiacus]|uniref:WxL domain-containing protein n=1 Tax=Enterococcus silesiacus TaxID=332949 RepID=A0AA91GC74_9ENTE|nr:hypothetical protein RV15_GL003005 [Enterococcus silesiacus]
MYFFIKNPEPISAVTPVGYKDLSQAENINMEDDSMGASVEIPGEYGFMFKLTDKVEYQGFGESNIAKNIRGSNSNGYQFNPIDQDKYPERGVWIRNAGIYNGRSVDLKLVIDNMAFREVEGKPGVYPNFNFIAVDPLDKYSQDNKPVSQMNTWNDLYLMVGSTSSTLAETSDKYHIGDTVDYHYEFYDSESKQRFVLSGAWNFNNINNLKATSIPFANDFSKMYGLAGGAEADSKMDIGYKLDTPIPGYIEMYGGNNKVNKKSGRLTHLFEKDSYTMKMERRYGNASNTPPTNPDTNTGNMGILYMTESIARIAPARPIVFGQRNSVTHTDPKYRELSYSILQNIADNTKLNRDSSFTLETEVPSYYSIDFDSVKIFEYGTTEEYTSIFNITKSPESDSKVIISAKDPTADLDPLNPNSKVFNAHVFDIKIVAKPNSTFKFDPDAYNYINDANLPDDNGFMSFEQAGVKTKMSYVYKEPSGQEKFKDTLEAKVIDNQTISKVLYEGVPDGDPIENITFSKGTDFSKVDEQTAYLENLRVDTKNKIDEPIYVTYKNGVQPNSSILGEQKVTLILTTAKGVTTEKVVTITIKDVSTSLTIQFMGEGGNEIHTPVVLDGNTTDSIDLSENTIVQGIISDLVSKGYTKLAWDNPFPENKTPYSAGTVTYKFQGNLALDSVPKTLNFGNLTYDAKDQRVENPTFKEKLVISDTRANPIQGWYLTAELADPMKNDKGQELVNALRYVDKGKESILDSNAQVVYTNIEGKDGKFIVSDKWGTTQGTDGIKLQINSSDTVYTGEYIGVITWKIMAGQP